MNLEQFLAAAVACIGLGLMTAVLYVWWDRRDQRRWEAELGDRELLVQKEQIEAQQVKLEAQQLRDEAEKRYQDAAELVKVARRQLYGMAAECEPLNDEMADTQLSISPVSAEKVVR